MDKAKIVPLAKDGFGKNSASYDANRPNYTKEIIEFILREITNNNPQSCSSATYKVLELGAGTGKLTEGLAPQVPKDTKYLATDPSADFLGHLKSKSLPVETAMAAANSLPLTDNSVENIVCAQCFHWFSNEESFLEMQRVLVPGGKLILVWNAHKYEEGWPTEVSKQRFEVMARVGASTNNWFNTMQWCKAIDSSPMFKLSQHKSLPGIECKCTIDKFIENLTTVSAYNALPKSECEEYLNTLKMAILAWPGVDPDDMDVPYSSEIYMYLSQKKE